VGTGLTNTAAIVASCGESDIAAKIADNLVLNEYSDWFLPSRDEADLMYTNLHLQGLGGFYIYGSYSTSSENSARKYWYSNFNGGGSYAQYKSNGTLVRVVRTFSY
jgi:hypothetical protein